MPWSYLLHLCSPQYFISLTDVKGKRHLTPKEFLHLLRTQLETRDIFMVLPEARVTVFIPLIQKEQKLGFLAGSIRKTESQRLL